MFISFFLIGSSFGQMISVTKAGTKKRRIYNVKDFIHVKTSSGHLSGELFSISDTLLIIADQAVHPDSILKVYDYSKGNFANALSKKLMAAGVFYFVLTTVNRTTNKDDPVFTDYNAQISAGLVAAGILVDPLKRRVFRMKRKGRLVVLNP